MKPIVCFGEALIDFLNAGQQQDGALMLNQFTQYPGGAPANAAVAIAKLGGNARFVGQVGRDNFGDFLINSLKLYHVDTRFTLQHETAKTALAFVFLDKNGDRSFLFHRVNSADMLLESSQIQDCWFEGAGIFHFCSNTLTETPIAEVTRLAIQKAKAQGAIISFDVNLRHTLWPTGHADINVVNELLPNCGLVKFSRDELAYLCAGDSEKYIAQLLSREVELVLITDGAKSVHYYTANSRGCIDVPVTSVVDTTAGGDCFIGGVLFVLSQLPSFSNTINNEQLLRKILSFAIHCGAIAVSRPGAFPAMPVMAEVSAYAGFLKDIENEQ